MFIDNRLAVDIGGQHGQVAGAVDLDTIGQNTGDMLVPGKTYDFHIFYVERHTGSSNFRMRTSIDLQVEASLFLTSDRRGSGMSYEVWQINKKSKLSCNFDANSAERDTTGGASTFKLTGGNLAGPEILGVGTHYEGIKITSDSTFSIDSAAIVSNYALAPGHYFLEITLKADPSQVTKVEITVPSYSVPSVAFAKEDWTVLGTQVSGDTAQIGPWAYATYQVNITFFEEWAVVNNYVHANAPVSGAVLTAKGAAAGVSVWTDLKFAEPPAPRVEKAIAMDRNGDGRADSLYVHFERAVNGKSRLDSIQLTFGETFVATSNFKIVNETDIVLTAEDLGAECTGKVCGFGSRQFTGDASGIYSGSLNNWFTYENEGEVNNFFIENEQVADGVGPIVLSASKKLSKDGSRLIDITFSEAISEESRHLFTEIFEYTCMRSGINEKPERPLQQGGTGAHMTLIYTSGGNGAVLPTDGDLIRFAPKGGAQDLAGNVPHRDNPWVAITGDQELGVENPGVVSLGEDPYGVIGNDTVTQVKLITDISQSAQQIADSLGVQGSLVNFDIAKIMVEQTKDAVEKFDAFVREVSRRERN